MLINNHNGKGDAITMEKVVGEKLSSTCTETLLGLRIHISNGQHI